MSLTTLKAFGAALLTPRFLINTDPAKYYDFLGDDVLEGLETGFKDPNKPLWLNLGYWKTARKYPDAARAMAAQLADAAKMGATDELLDVGFGFAEQDLFWLDRYRVKRIVGLNVTPNQVERAKERVKARGADDRIDLRLGSATEVPFPDGSFDKVTALECAHHFDSREKFFHEAFRVLRSGGTLATADGVPSPGDPALTFLNRIALRRWCVPLVNMYDRNEYKRKLEAIGFVNVKAESIRNYVFPGITKYHALRNKGLTIDSAVVELSEEEMQRCDGIDFMEVTGITDYVLFSADKP